MGVEGVEGVEGEEISTLPTEKETRYGVNQLPSLSPQAASLSPLFTLSFLKPVGGFAAVKLGELDGVEVSVGLCIGDWFSVECLQG